MTSDAADRVLYSLLDDRPGTSARVPDWETHALERVSAHVRELAGESDDQGQGIDGKASRNWESQAVERLARYLRTTAR
jgi:hypothetical protein